MALFGCVQLKEKGEERYGLPLSAVITEAFDAVDGIGLFTAVNFGLA